MSRLIRNTAILAKIEPVYGVDAVPTGAANAMLVSTLSLNPLNAQNVDRNNIRPFLGGDEQLVGSRYVEMGFDVELVGAGTLGIAPAWGPLLRACGFAEVITAGVRVDYVPISTGFESTTIYWYDDGVLHKGLGARGTASLKLSVGEKPVISCKFVCLYGGIGAAAAPTADLEEWQVPEIVLDANSGKLMWGATHATATPPALVGGESYPSKGLTIDLGVTSPFQALLGGESVPITERKVTGAVQLELTAIQEVASMAAVLATAKTSLGMIHGTVAGSRVAVFMPGVQRIEPSKEDLNGARMIGYKLLVNPIAGNDEIRIATSF